MSDRLVQVSQRNAAFFDAMRQSTDPLADAVIDELFRSGQVDEVNALMRTLVANDVVDASSQLAPGVRQFLGTTGSLPSWADHARIHQGQQLFWRYGPKMIAILHCYSLPFCYAAQKGVQVLALTGRLFSNPTRRIVETAQMLVDVLAPGGLTAGTGKGIRTIQKVRLMHAGVRHLTLRSGQWNGEWDQPINQEDLALTLLSFSWAMIDGLRKLGVPLTSEEAEDYQHCWNVIGHLLGIRDDLLPNSVADAAALVPIFQGRLYGECAEGRDMTNALVQMMQRIVPGDSLDFAPPAFLRYFMGKEHAALLGVEPHLIGDLLEKPTRWFGVAGNKVLHDAGYFGPLSETFSKLLILGLLHVMRAGNKPSFQIPEQLRQQWGLQWTS